MQTPPAIHDLKQRLQPHARTLWLAASYLLIIMVMSLAFSAIFYHTSAREIGRQLPPDSFFGGGPGVNFDQFHTFFANRISNGQHDLFGKLLLINLAVLVVGAFLSYVLARRTLGPIEQAIEAQSRFASDASHELRTPLAAIQTENEVALRNPSLTLERAKELLASNLEEAVRLRSLADGLLRLAREGGEPVALQPILLADVTTAAVQQVQKAAAARRIAIQNTTPPKLSLESDSGSLGQILAVLLDNAIKYSPDGGTVRLTARQSDGQVLINVRDNGTGIRPDELPYIFERFYRADSSRSKQNAEGHGLGLSLAAQLVAQLGGTITAKSKPDNGSTFTINLPLSQNKLRGL